MNKVMKKNPKTRKPPLVKSIDFKYDEKIELKAKLLYIIEITLTRQLMARQKRPTNV